MKAGNQYVGPVGATGDVSPATGFDKELMGLTASNPEYYAPDQQGPLGETITGGKGTLQQGSQYPVGIHNRKGE